MKLVKIELSKWVSDEGKVFRKKGTNEYCTELYPSLLNPIENYDEQKLVLDSFLDPIIMTNQETYGRGMTN